MAGYLAGMLNQLKYDVQIIDSFGIDSNSRKIENQFMIIGVDENYVANILDRDTKIAFIYCRTIEDLLSVEKIIKAIKELRKDVKINKDKSALHNSKLITDMLYTTDNTTN